MEPITIEATNSVVQTNHHNEGDEPALEAPLYYARQGWQVIPVHYVGKDGCCTCKNPECNSPGKHPRTEHGWEDGTTDEITIRSWWARWRGTNVAIVTGTVSGIVVLDVDPRHGGDHSLRALEAKHGPLPDTLKAQTGGGGTHLFFTYPSDRKIGCPVGFVDGLDVRGDGGFVVAAPSTHSSGGSYSWGGEPDVRKLSPMPDWLIELITTPMKLHCAAKSTSTTSPTLATAAPTGPQPEFKNGTRNSTLTSMAGTMRRKGFDVEAIRAALNLENLKRCKPPLAETEINAIACSIAKYSPASALRTAPLTDLGNGERLAAFGGNELRYWAERKSWLCWDVCFR